MTFKIQFPDARDLSFERRSQRATYLRASEMRAWQRSRPLPIYHRPSTHLSQLPPSTTAQ